MKKLLIAIVALVLVGMAAPAWAIPFSTTGVGDPNLRADVDFAYIYNIAFGYAISIAITNTSSIGAGPDPRLTAFAFNVPDEVTGISFFGGETGWGGLYDPDDIDTPGQFGFFDSAGLTGPNFGGGSPNYGVDRGSTSFFMFGLEGSDLDLLDEHSFLDLDSNPPGDVQFFMVRWQRTGPDPDGDGPLDPQGSDVGIPSIPEPSTMLLLGVGLIGLAGIGRKKFAKK